MIHMFPVCDTVTCSVNMSCTPRIQRMNRIPPSVFNTSLSHIGSFLTFHILFFFFFKQFIIFLRSDSTFSKIYFTVCPIRLLFSVIGAHLSPFCCTTSICFLFSLENQPFFFRLPSRFPPGRR